MIRTSPESWNYTLIAGATMDETWTVYTTSAGTAVVDLSGCTGTASCRESYTAGSAILSFGTADLILGGTAGTLQFNKTAAQTAAFGSALGYAGGQVVFDCEITEGGGDVSRVLQGVWTISPEVTR